MPTWTPWRGVRPSGLGAGRLRFGGGGPRPRSGWRPSTRPRPMCNNWRASSRPARCVWAARKPGGGVTLIEFKHWDFVFGEDERMPDDGKVAYRSSYFLLLFFHGCCFFGCLSGPKCAQKTFAPH